MPHTWNNILVVTKGELVPAFYTSAALDKNLNRYKDKSYGIKRARKGGGGHELLINYDSLPAEIQNAIPDHRKINHILERYYEEDGEAYTYYGNYRFDDLSYLKREHQEQYTVNASVLKAVIRLRMARVDERSSKGGSLRGNRAIPGKAGLKSVSKTIWEDAMSFNLALKVKHNVSHNLPESEKHFHRVLKDFETTGYDALVSGKHRNQNRRKVTDDILNLLENLFAGNRQKPSPTEVYRKYDAFINGGVDLITADGEILQPGDFEQLSERTVTAYLNMWKSKIATHALRSGNRQVYMGKFTPYHSMHKGKYASSIISVDDRQPPFKMPDGNRVWFYLAKDLASDVFTTWVHGKTKEGILIDFYRQMVRNYAAWGLPLPLELEAEMSLNSSHTETFLKPGVMFQHVRIEANRARTKRIERDNKELRYNYEKDQEGWLARPNARQESNQAGPGEVKTRYYDDIVEMALDNIEKWNNKPHAKHKHMSRWQVFMNTQNPDLKPINYALILPYLGHKAETSCRLGIIKFNYNEHLIAIDGKIALGQKLLTLMDRLEGEDVTVYWLDDNDRMVLKAVVYIDGQLICEAMPKPVYYRAKAEQTEADLEAITIMSAYVATIEAYGKRRKKTVEPVLLIDNRKPQFDDFQMPGRKKWQPSDRLTEILPDAPEPEAIDFIDSIPTHSYQRPLTDRF